MGIKHLKEIKEFLEKNADRAFSRTELREILKQNYTTVNDNLDYLIQNEGVVVQDNDKPARFKWKGTDTNELSTEES